jgi:hypothetical protein
MAKDLTAALHALTQQAQGQTSRQDKMLPSAKDATTIPERSGASGLIQSPGSGGAIVSPLTETLYTERTFHDVRQYKSTDGIFVIELRPVKSINFKDAADIPLVIEFKAKA